MSPVPMDHHEKMRLRAAAFRVTRLYPGPVGELLSRELLTWEEFGYRLGGSQLVMRLVDHVLKAPLAQGDAAATSAKLRSRQAKQPHRRHPDGRRPAPRRGAPCQTKKSLTVARR